jgi:ribosomal protein S14
MSKMVAELDLGFSAFMRESSNLSSFTMINKFIHFNDYEKQNTILKILFNNKIINKNKLTHLHRNNKKSSITILRNSCLFTKRNRAIITKYKISRSAFKRLYKC